jgi:hypothetical protein
MAMLKKQKRTFRQLQGLLVVFGLVLGGVALWQVSARPSLQMSLSDSASSTGKAEVLPQSLINGTPTTTTLERVLGVMIDNHPDVTSQAGLSRARVVYEAMVEGSFTRFFALYTISDEAPRVGPVRSARPYFLDWLAEYGDSSYWHSGGSPDALALIKKRNVFDVNEFYRGPYFWRDRSISAPHNLFTNSIQWQRYLGTEIISSTRPLQEYSGWKFEAVGSPTQNASSSRVSEVVMSYTGRYLVGWKYDVATDRYSRTVNAVQQVDDDGAQVLADTIIIQEVPTRVLDEEGRREMDTIGSGLVRVIQHGMLIRGTWKKEAVSSRTRFYDVNGEEIALKPGTLWVQIVPPNTPVTISS